MTTLLLDNYDSFTYNLFHLIASARGEEPLVVYNDQMVVEEIRTLPIDSVVISPGPGRPGRSRDFGVCGEVLRHLHLPQLGICLGHQGLGHTFGARIGMAPVPVHGEVAHIEHCDRLLFAGIPQDFAAVRYHSLVVHAPLPACLRAIAWTPEGLLMAMAHRDRPLWGVQFHPESVCTEYGLELMRNFLGQVPRPTRVGASGAQRRRATRPTALATPGRAPALFHWRRLQTTLDAEEVFGGLFAAEAWAFWLDSALPGPNGRYSYMGSGRSALRYWAADRLLRHEQPDGCQTHHQRLTDYLRSCRSPAEPHPAPFPFAGGWVGYLGYEFRAETTGPAAPRSPCPDAVLLEAGEFLVFDHAEGALYLAYRGDEGGAHAWFEATAARLRALPPQPAIAPADPGGRFCFRLRRGRETYLADIERCLEAIRTGESYELCLTNQFDGPPLADPWAAYRTLRRHNPAPYAAYLRAGELRLLCSSPEQFLRVDAAGQVSTRPIKGTRPRGETPDSDALLRAELATAIKDRAENLMITDLLRHDLGRVCRPGSVRVPALMAVESFAAYHQLVSTVEGWLRPGLDGLDCLRAAFPGGSMTGAPKLRTMELLDRIEGGPRGPYSGALGYIGADGSLELNIVIRTAVCHAGGTSVGAGGAIVARSVPEAEFEELRLKARPVLEALALAQTGRRVVSPGQIE